jgi:hypothetical protein
MEDEWKNETYKAMCAVFERALATYQSRASVSPTLFYQHVLETLGECPLSRKRVMLYLNKWFSSEEKAKEGWIRFGKHSWIKKKMREAE